MTSLYHKLEILETEKISPITKKEAEFIYDFIKKNKITKTLETGFGCGFSAAFIISATNDKHYAVDPYQDSVYYNFGLKNIYKLKFDKFLIFENDFSHNVLPKLLNKGIKINLVLFQKRGDDKRKWYHFKEFCNPWSYLTYKIFGFKHKGN